jgi:enamine deaminase RidA (YjgF/YER057c/UK114 family)
MARQIVSANRPWEPIVGYSRACRIGNTIEVSGTTANRDGDAPVGGDDPYLQAKDVLNTIGEALKACGATFDDVIRTRVFLANVEDWEAVGRAHGEIFRELRPACTFVQAGALLAPDLLVEIEATALLADE